MENPADVALIRVAERSVGDFKLKSDPTYVAPEVGSELGRRGRGLGQCLRTACTAMTHVFHNC